LDALQDVLAQEIGDPTLRLLLPGRGGMLTDLTGRPVKAGLTRTRALTPINRSDRLLCVIEHDAALTETNQTARIAFAFTGLVMESVWLSTQVIESRRRLLEAELAERRRIERDIHDGAQQGFYEAITLLDTARSRAVAEGSIALADQLATTKDRLTDALKVLRKISQRVHPHTLVHHGLRESVAGLARDHSGVLTYEIPDQRWPSRVESTAYFVIAEGVSNVIEHAALGASIHVMVTTDGDDLVVTFIYKGQGGADVSSDGLGSLEDRVAAAGGHLVVDSARRGDTRLVARLPNEVSIESPSLEGDDS
jgi:signal transduction histidine kinase